MAFAPGAMATVVPLTNGDGAVTGVDGLVVDGSTYDVTFEADKGQSPPAPFFTSVALAEDASAALGSALATFRSEGDRFIVNCPTPTSGKYMCYIITPAPSVFGVSLSVDTQSSPVDFIKTITGQPNVANGPFPAGANYAIWTSASSGSSVPEASPLALMGIGMAGVAAARAVRRKKKPA
jgi:hypothetical protein